MNLTASIAFCIQKEFLCSNAPYWTCIIELTGSPTWGQDSFYIYVTKIDFSHQIDLTKVNFKIALHLQ